MGQKFIHPQYEKRKLLQTSLKNLGLRFIKDFFTAQYKDDLGKLLKRFSSKSLYDRKKIPESLDILTLDEYGG